VRGNLEELGPISLLTTDLGVRGSTPPHGGFTEIGVTKSAGYATSLRLREIRMIARSFVKSISAAAMMLLAAAGAPRAGTEDDVKALFGKFIAAQNAHDVKAVGEILLDSPQFFWITRNTPIWGHDAALKRFEENYKGTWLLEPKFDEVKVTELSPEAAQLFVPAVFTIAPAGQTAQPRNFLLTQIYVRTNSGWRLATILPFPVP
jgi:ketosteroid isomerase-like protein